MAADGSFVVAGLARPRAAWFAEVGDWAGSSVVPVTFLRCVSAAELRRRLTGGRLDAAMVEAGANGVDAELGEAARRAGVLVIVVGDPDASDPGAPPHPGSPRLPHRFTADELVGLLRAHLGDERWDLGAGRQADRGPDPSTGTGTDTGSTSGTGTGTGPMPGIGRPAAHRRGRTAPAGPRAPLVAVLGPGGCGASTVAIAVAQGLAAATATRRGATSRSGVVLADLAVPGSQAMYHDAGDVVPGVPELVEACRAGTDDPVRRLLFGIDRRGYSVLLGCRSQRDRQLVDAATIDLVLDHLRDEADLVVADTDVLLTGGPSDGPGAGATSWDRLAIGRSVVRAADVVLLCATDELRAIHGMLRLEQSLVEAGVPIDRLVRVLNRSAGRRGAGPALARDLAALSGRVGVASVVVPRHRAIERCHVTGDPMPRAVVAPLADAVLGALGRS